MAIAAGLNHSVALRNDGTVICWGDNSNYQTNTPGSLTNVHLIAAGRNQTLASINSPFIQYPIDVSKDLLLIYNTNSVNSRSVKDYYLQHRPLVSNANVLAIKCPAQETISRAGTDTNLNLTSITAPIAQWLTDNPTKRPRYWILFYDIPARINVNTNEGWYPGLSDPTDNSVSFELSSTFGNPFVMNLNGSDTNSAKAYIDKLERFGTNYSPGKLVIRPSAGATSYPNTNYVFDDIRHGAGWGEDNHSGDDSGMPKARDVLIEAGVTSGAIVYSNLEEKVTIIPGVSTNYHNIAHLTGATNLAGYACWGFHSSLGSDYSFDGDVQWGTNSQWWIITTIESFNGQRIHGGSGRFTLWLSANTFGSSDYSNAPIGIISKSLSEKAEGSDERLTIGKKEK